MQYVRCLTQKGRQQEAEQQLLELKCQPDILVVDGNPLEDISVLGSGGDRLSVIMKNGSFHKRAI